ncbi:hypothetical protein KMW28_11990 [Flammeovirga yaeyamensis]|uniref:HNH domain-containing protein n=1 Tax=Flammeovirga yaeyamensis TaxID=367791 RepID=A0AAX1MYI9_9BACT|nr:MULTISPECIES: hypothetical protein [Flammeovirga]ANQ48199.1 hypothetical protein MY04_0817 [Flammeovirga sp. MY04]MBB3696115.1 hypothetical protein [Flammeovirga yaeyamensis]NMF34799.1 hypothetical protein [Flammeovirga yaeyamensis]QWG00373.1 hypothetical protein KMW28_11990 [Flammeovirga yaeyamensis]
MKKEKEGECELCKKNLRLTFHHLIPKSNHKNKWFRKNYDMMEMRERGIMVCRSCHSFIHKTHSEKVLGRHFNTLEKLLEDERILKYVRWAQNH